MRGIVLSLVLLFSQMALAQISLKPDFYRTCVILFNEGYCEALKERTIALKDQAKEGGGIMLEFFDQKIRPQLIKSYQAYLNGPGDQVGDYYWRSYQYLKPKTLKLYQETIDYWYAEYPELFDQIRFLPKPLKTATENLLFYIWDKHKDKVESGEIDLPEILKIAFEILKDVDDVRSGKSMVAPEEQARLDRLLNDLRPYSLDRRMADCFRVYGVPSDITNAFNTICSIFLNKELYDLLDDDELRAVIAHEMGHGTNGDNLKTAGTFVTSTVHHLTKMFFEGTLWLLTNEEYEYFKETSETENGNWEMILRGAAERASYYELSADVLGARLLNKAGYSAQPLITALCKLHGVDPDDIPKDLNDIESFRNYPSLYKRVLAIEKEMKF